LVDGPAGGAGPPNTSAPKDRGLNTVSTFEQRMRGLAVGGGVYRSSSTCWRRNVVDMGSGIKAQVA